MPASIVAAPLSALKPPAEISGPRNTSRSDLVATGAASSFSVKLPWTRGSTMWR
jgi:hypothetical protein